jgi:hypothetical protein
VRHLQSNDLLLILLLLLGLCLLHRSEWGNWRVPRFLWRGSTGP